MLAPPQCCRNALRVLPKLRSLTPGVRALCSPHIAPLSCHGEQPQKWATIHQLFTLHPRKRSALRGPSAPGPLTAHFVMAPLFYLTSTDQTKCALALDMFLINKLLCFTWFKFKLLFGF